MDWTGRVYFAKNVVDSDTALCEKMSSRQWSGIIFEITFKDSEKGDEINCMKEMIGYLNDDLKKDD